MSNAPKCWFKYQAYLKNQIKNKNALLGHFNYIIYPMTYHKQTHLKMEHGNETVVKWSSWVTCYIRNTPYRWKENEFHFWSFNLTILPLYACMQLYFVQFSFHFYSLWKCYCVIQLLLWKNRCVLLRDTNAYSLRVIRSAFYRCWLP